MADIEKLDANAKVRSLPDAHAQTGCVDSKQADEAMEIVNNESSAVSFTPEQERRLLRKIDWHIMPLMCIVYALQFWDKTTLSYASIMGLQAQTHLVGQDYSWLGTIFYFGYLAFEYPANLMMQRLPLAKFTAVNTLLWGAVLACMAAATDFSSLAAVRFLLGMFEASVTPGFVLVTSQWYKVNEQGSRIGIWFSFIGVAQIVGGLIAYGLAKGDAAGEFSIHGYKVVFLLCGLLTAVFGFLLFFFLPDSPVTARFLTPQEKELAIERIRGNNQGVGNRYFKPYQCWEALKDGKTWFFFSIIIASFGFTSQQSLLYGCPAGAVQIITLVGFLWLGDKLNRRLLMASISEAISVLGIALCYGLPADLKVGRLIGYYLANASSTAYVTILSLVASNVAGYTKKTTVSALVLVAFAVGNLIGPQAFQAKDAPRYTPGLGTIVGCWSLCVLLLLVIWFVNHRDNRRRDSLRDKSDYVHMKNQEFLDLTDGENMEFRYRT
ncbi:putative MFS allantoate transporter [Calocera cornea HHB12733]|uniref:Putative MFS allantoate transporter n=1 Tax=Calocera cornea HHB12733 TaxID=1353952 RepID=A0A165G0J5_9BASI|nr:putative MFS allantoate transporter [Calocera cornea HHB12733]